MKIRMNNPITYAGVQRTLLQNPNDAMVREWARVDDPPPRLSEMVFDEIVLQCWTHFKTTPRDKPTSVPLWT